MKISCLLLAAGDSSRMLGKNKLMLEVDGASLVRRTLEEIFKVTFEEVIVVTGFESNRIEKTIADLGATFAFNKDHQTGMHSSIKTGLRALTKDCDAFFVCLADQPYFNHLNLLKLMGSFATEGAGQIFVPSFEGKRGQPVLISAAFIPEILAEPDGDHGCAYLLKRHPGSVTTVEIEDHSVLIDVDEPQDYERVHRQTTVIKDPVEEFLAKTIEMRRSGEPYAVASVIEVIGSSSARTGSKAIFDKTGTNLLGWVGGGCAERFIGEESKKSIVEGKTRVILADLDDEIFGLGVACGGKMRVFIEPVLPSEGNGTSRNEEI